MVSFRLSNYEVPDYDTIDINFNNLSQSEKEKIVLKYLRLFKKVSKDYGKYNEDLLQDLMVKLFEDIIVNFDRDKDFYPYLSRCVNNFLNKRNKNKIEEYSLENKINDMDLLELLSSDKDAYQEFMEKKLQNYLTKLIDNLDKKDKKIVKMYYGFYGKTNTLREIANHVDISYEAVRLRLNKVKRVLRKRVKWDSV